MIDTNSKSIIISLITCVLDQILMKIRIDSKFKLNSK